MERIELINKLKDFLDYKRFILTFCLLIFCAGLNLIYPFIYKYFIDFVLFQENIKNLLVVIFLMIFWLLLCIIINLLLCKVRTRFLTLMIRNLKNKIFDGLIECPLVYYRSKDINEIKQIIEDDVKELETFFLNDIFAYILAIITVIFLLFIMFFLNNILLFCCLIFFFISYIETKLIKKYVVKNSKELRNSIVAENHKRVEEFNYYTEIKMLGMEFKIVEKFGDRSKVLIKLVTKEKILQYVNKYLGALNHDLITRFFIYIIGGIIVINGEFSTSSFLVFLGFYETFIKNIRLLIESNFSFNNKKVKLINIVNIIKDVVNIKDQNIYLNNEKIAIKCDKIYFKYDEKRTKRWIINDFERTFYGGRKYLLKGINGSGKSTFLKLLYHEYSVNKGRILINNQDVTQIIPQNFYDKFAIASTDTKIFNMTLRDNLLLANSDASETMLYDACKKAEIYDWIISLPDKLDFKVGENGEKLSGGQQERLIVARLFLKKASIYILDEALSEISLDDEIGILNRLFKNNPDAIFFIVSHRIKQLPNVEEIVIGA